MLESDPHRPDAPIVEARTVRKHYGGVVALSDGNIALRSGEVHALVGDNGAGKSTMIKILSGAVQPTSGEVLVDGEPVKFHDPNIARAHGISTVFQDLALVDHLDFTGNLFLGHEIVRGGALRWFGVLDPKAMRRRAVAEVHQLKVNVRSVDQRVMGMSGGQRQAVAVARAIAFGTRIVIMDEPTAALGVRERGAVLDLIQEVGRQGVTVLMVSHSLPDVFQVAHRITILRHGRTVKSMDTSETNLQEIVAMMTGAWEAGGDSDGQ
jgi:ABC-type sugar transport system ATPase subunit